MFIKEYDHRNAKDLLEAKGIIYLENKLSYMQELCAEDSLHSVVMKIIKADSEWQTRFLVPESKPSRVKKKLFYDLYNTSKKVALEVEFTRFDRLFRDFMKLTRGYNAGVVDAGVIITLFSETELVKLTKSLGVAPTLKMCSGYLKYFYSEISVPLWIIGLCSEEDYTTENFEIRL